MPTAVALATIPDVELIHAGTWQISTGEWTVTLGDLASACEALACPAIRKPVLKVGHTDPRFDGEPAVGWIDNMRVGTDGYTLLGDFTDMPAWLADVAASAYPDRSVEAQQNFVCQIGHTHPLVVTGVALLGVTAPGIGTLESLNDVADLYGVAASGGSTPISVLVKGPHMAQHASVSVEEVRREYYEDAPWSSWIVEFTLNPLQLIVCNDDDGTFSRIPVTVLDDDSFSFGPPIPVEQTFVDKPADTPNTAASRVVFASREQSRPPTKGPGMNAAMLREALELPADASDLEVTSALAASGFVPSTETPAPAPVAVPEGLTLVDETALADLQVAAAAGVEARTILRTNERDAAIQAAIGVGKFAPARRDHYAASWDADPEGTRTLIDTLSPNLVPVTASGYAGDTDPADVDEFAHLFPPTSRQEA